MGDTSPVFANCLPQNMEIPSNGKGFVFGARGRRTSVVLYILTVLTHTLENLEKTCLGLRRYAVEGIHEHRRLGHLDWGGDSHHRVGAFVRVFESRLDEYL